MSAGSMRRSVYLRNFLALLGDAIAFGLAVTFASATTTLPDFVRTLTSSQAVVGLFSAASSGAWLIPQLLYARHLTHQRRKKPFVVLGAAIGRPFYLLYALLLWLAFPGAGPALLACFAAQMVFMGSDALAAVAWFDLYAKAIPANRRGRLVGIAQAVRGLLAIGAGIVIAEVLGQHGPPFPQNYAILFALAGGCLLLSLLSLSLVVEPDEPVEAERLSWADYLPQLLSTLRQDAAFRRLVLVRLLAGFDSLALSFYILFARRELGLPPETVGAYTTVQTVGSILASVALGTVSERLGSHRVIQIATVLGLTAPLLALGLFLGQSPGNTAVAVAYGWVFLVIGITQSAAMLGFFNYALELAPPGRRPSYMGLFNTLSGVLLVLPPLGGLLQETASYGALFALTAAVLLPAHLLSRRLPAAQGASPPQQDPV